jgi:outer membrane protein assembly factor BamE (lipoprotein component of BamABCDE complex)
MQAYIKIFIFFFLTSCLMEKQDGFIFEDEILSEIKVGQSEEFVKLKLGTPSFVIEKNRFFYVSVVKKYRAFFRSQITYKKVMEFSFANGILKEIREHNAESDLEYGKILTKIKAPSKKEINSF